jgi:alpha-1,6-mannosyltransferase
VRIVRLANFVSPTSGGLRTALRHLGEGYAAAGHEPVLVVPGAVAGDELTGQGRVITVPGPVVPGTGGYRVLVARRRLARLLSALAPDVLEVSDRTTLRWSGRWAREQRVPAVMVSHESLAGLLRLWRTPGADRLADRLNAASAAAYDRVIATTGWAAAEFRRLGVSNLVEIPLGVDLDLFHPSRRRPSGAGVRIVHCSRLSPEKRPELAIDTLAELRAAGVPAELVVIGDGPRQAALAQRAAGLRLPVRFTGFLPSRTAVARLLAGADVVIAPGPVETFGLAALEALAAGTPVVVNAASALPEVVGDAGIAAAGTGVAFAAAVRELLARPEPARRAAARARAERFEWQAAVDGFLTVHHELAAAHADDAAARAHDRRRVAAR